MKDCLNKLIEVRRYIPYGLHSTEGRVTGSGETRLRVGKSALCSQFSLLMTVGKM